MGILGMIQSVVTWALGNQNQVQSEEADNKAEIRLERTDSTTKPVWDEKMKKKMIKHWYQNLMEATTYEEWLIAASNIDKLEGADSWRRDPTSPYYDSKRLSDILQELHKAVANQDLNQMLYALRSGLVRNLAGIGNPLLHNHTYVGTKNLIQQHQTMVTTCLWDVANAPEDVIPLEERLRFFTDSRHALGKTALMLSGGAGLGIHHFGVIKALWLQQLLPRVISGSSAGAIIAAFMAAITEADAERLFREPGAMKKHYTADKLMFFGRSPAASWENIKRFLTSGVLMDVSQLQKTLQENVGNLTFHEAYELSGRIINITVSPGNNFESSRLLNYLTAPHVLVWSAASASCALPGLFSPVELVCKDSKGNLVPFFLSKVKWTDGSLHSDLPYSRLQELFNVNYFIVSQTNPHAIPFVQNAQRGYIRTPHHRDRPSLIQRTIEGIVFVIKSEVLHRCRQGLYLGLLPSSFGRLINQVYVGDVTVVPPVSISMYMHTLSNPTPETLDGFIAVGERRTWPNIGMIRSQCQIEIVLDQCVRKLALEAQFAMERRSGGRREQLTWHNNLKIPSDINVDLRGSHGGQTVMQQKNKHLAMFTSFGEDDYEASMIHAEDVVNTLLDGDRMVCLATENPKYLAQKSEQGGISPGRRASQFGRRNSHLQFVSEEEHDVENADIAVKQEEQDVADAGERRVRSISLSRFPVFLDQQDSTQIPRRIGRVRSLNQIAHSPGSKPFWDTLTMSLSSSVSSSLDRYGADDEPIKRSHSDPEDCRSVSMADAERHNDYSKSLDSMSLDCVTEDMREIMPWTPHASFCESDTGSRRSSSYTGSASVDSKEKDSSRNSHKIIESAKGV